MSKWQHKHAGSEGCGWFGWGCSQLRRCLPPWSVWKRGCVQQYTSIARAVCPGWEAVHRGGLRVPSCWPRRSRCRMPCSLLPPDLLIVHLTHPPLPHSASQAGQGRQGVSGPVRRCLQLQALPAAAGGALRVSKDGALLGGGCGGGGGGSLWRAAPALRLLLTHTPTVCTATHSCRVAGAVVDNVVFKGVKQALGGRCEGCPLLRCSYWVGGCTGRLLSCGLSGSASLQGHW